MTLSALIRKRDAGNPATATTAISATQPVGRAKTVASIATVTVANPKEAKTALTPIVAADDTATASCRRLIHGPARDPQEVAHFLEGTHFDSPKRYPDAVVAEPFAPTIRQTSTPLTANEEAAIRAWLALIEENDPATIAAVIENCRQDCSAAAYFSRRANDRLG